MIIKKHKIYTEVTWKWNETTQQLEQVYEDSFDYEGDVVQCLPHMTVDKEAAAEQAIKEGCEGLVIKNLQGIYRAGAREYLWIKLKREYKSEMSDTLDLVVIGAIYGKGKRVNRYGALLLAAYNKEEDMFRSFCKVGTGFSDEQLKIIYEKLQKCIIKDKHVMVDSKMEVDVWFKPNIVLEITGSEITISPIHTANMNEFRKDFGLALRFPIFTGRIREDKQPSQATATTEIVNMYNKQSKKITH